MSDETQGPQGPRGEDDYAALVRGLLADLAGTRITRLEARQGDLHIALTRTPGLIAASPLAGSGATPEEQGRPTHWLAVEAPLTGIYYERPSPDDEPYVHTGSRVEPDSVVGLIETMKMFNEVTADVRGIVRDVAVANGDLIQAGQIILYVEPDDEMAGPPLEAP